MNIKFLTAAAAASLAFVMPARACSIDSDIEGSYRGVLLSKTGEESDAEILLDDYKRFALSIRKDRGMETGFYTVQGSRLVLKISASTDRRVFEILPDCTLKAVYKEEEEHASKDCCLLQK